MSFFAVPASAAPFFGDHLATCFGGRRWSTAKAQGCQCEWLHNCVCVTCMKSAYCDESRWCHLWCLMICWFRDASLGFPQKPIGTAVSLKKNYRYTIGTLMHRVLGSLPHPNFESLAHPDKWSHLRTPRAPWAQKMNTLPRKNSLGFSIRGHGGTWDLGAWSNMTWDWLGRKLILSHSRALTKNRVKQPLRV